MACASVVCVCVLCVLASQCVLRAAHTVRALSPNPPPRCLPPEGPHRLVDLDACLLLLLREVPLKQLALHLVLDVEEHRELAGALLVALGQRALVVDDDGADEASVDVLDVVCARHVRVRNRVAVGGPRRGRVGH